MNVAGNVIASGERAAAVHIMSGGTLITGDVTVLVQGIHALPTDFTGGTASFLASYLGTPRYPVPFGGRDAELANLDRWLDDPQAPPYRLLSAPPGRGKSALLVRWTQRLRSRTDLVAIFVPVSIRFSTNRAGVVFLALGTLLACLHGEKVPDANTPVVVLRNLVAAYLARPLPGGRCLLVVLDGLDEAADWGPGPDLFPPSPPEGLRVVLSTRLRAGDADAGSWLASLGWDRPGLARPLDLGRLTQAGVADVLRQMGCPLEELGQRVDLVAELRRLSEGDPLLLKLYVDDLWARGEEVARLKTKDLSAIPPGLDGYLQRWWEDQERLWGDRDPLEKPLVRFLLKALAFAVGPLSQKDVLDLAKAALPEIRPDSVLLNKALRPLNRLVIGDGKGQGYVFSHPRLAMHFADEYEGDREEVESLFLGWGQQTLTALNEGSLAPAKASHYLVQYYGAHLERAGQGPEELLALVSDGWRRAWEALEGGYAGFLNDAGRAWRSAVAADEAQVGRGGLAPYLGGEVCCALCRASVQSLAGNIPPALLTAVVERGLWSAIQGLAFAQQIPELGRRAEALAALAEHLAEPQRGEALAQALEAARAIGSEGPRSEALAALALHLATRPASPLYSLWSQTLPVLASRTRKDLLADLGALVPVILRLGGPQAAADVYRAILDVGQWWP